MPQLVTGPRVPSLRPWPALLGMTGKGHKWEDVSLGSKGDPERGGGHDLEKRDKCKWALWVGRPDTDSLMPLLL